MKKAFLLSLVFMLLAAALPAAADSVWTPMDDYFMSTWSPDSDNTCVSLERPYYMGAGSEGFVTAVRTPLDRTPLRAYPNGTEFKISFVCGKGDDLWGAVESIRPYGQSAFQTDYTASSGYIAFGDLVRSYDAEAFIGAHSKEIHAFAENGYDLCSGAEFVLWTAPNSGVQLEYVTKDYISFLCMDYDPQSSYRMFNFGGYYIDEYGNRWVEVTLRRSYEHGWFCLDRMTDGGIKPGY